MVASFFCGIAVGAVGMLLLIVGLCACYAAGVRDMEDPDAV